REHLGEREAGCTRDRRRRRPGARRLGADVEHVDDAAPAPFLHPRPGKPGEPDGGEQLLVEVLAPDLVADLLEGAVARGAGIVNPDVDVAEGPGGSLVDALDVGRDADVARNGGDAALSAGANRLARRIERRAPARRDQDVGARGGEARRDRKPEALAA